MAANPAESQKKSSRRLDPLDLFDVRSLLSEEEQMVKDSVGRMVDEKVLPIIREHFENHTFPAELVGELAGLGLFGSSLEGYGCAGMNARQLRAHLPGARARRLGPAQLRLRAVEPVHVPDPHLRQRGAEAEVPAAHGHAARSSAASGSPSRTAARTRPT